MDRCDTIKVKPWGKDQGEFVVINAEDFDASFHKKFGEAAPAPAAPSPPAEKAAPKPRAKKGAR